VSYIRDKVICDFWVPGKPTALARPRASLMYMDAGGKRRMWHQGDETPRKRKNIFVGMFTPSKNKGIRPMIPTLAMQSMRKHDLWKAIEGPVAVDVCFVFSYNMSDTKAVKANKSRHIVPHIKKPDIDNLNKMILDAMSGTVYGDDTQVMAQSKLKIYGPHDGVRIRVMAVDMVNIRENIDLHFPLGLDDKDRSGSLI